MAQHVTIAVDAIGGDFGPEPVLAGVEQALVHDRDLTVILCGPKEVVEPFAKTHERCIAQVCTEEITMDEHPAQAVRTKKDSSIVVGCRLVKENKADGFFSAGSTGACMSAATLIAGRIKGVMRPTLCSALTPPGRASIVLGDIGANADCKPEYLMQFAQMMGVYAQQVLQINRPRIALLNIGSEEVKGSQLARDAYQLMEANLEGFVGNVEGNDLFCNKADVIVADGFSGNICLKVIEGTFTMVFGVLKDVLMSSTTTKLAALALKGPLQELKRTVSSDAYGAALLLGVKGACTVGHGATNPRAVENGIFTAAQSVRLDVSGIIEQEVRKTATNA